MKIVVLQTMAFTPPDMSAIPASVAEKCFEADAVIAVYQDETGEPQVQVTVAEGKPTPETEVFVVV